MVVCVHWLLVVILSLAKLSSPSDSPSDPDGPSQTPDYSAESSRIIKVNCSQGLLPGQFLCNEAAHIHPRTQQLEGCNQDTELASISCQTAPGIICQETGNSTFFKNVPCKWTNGYDFDTALLLSIFLGFFGADRFYLGYPAIGVLKFSTLGFFFLGHLLDIILIASQVVGPADGSNYVVSYYGPVLNVVGIDNETTRKPLSDWF